MPGKTAAGGSKKHGRHLQDCAAYKSAGRRWRSHDRRCRKAMGKSYAEVWAKSRRANGLDASGEGWKR